MTIIKIILETVSIIILSMVALILIMELMRR